MLLRTKVAILCIVCLVVLWLSWYRGDALEITEPGYKPPKLDLSKLNPLPKKPIIGSDGTRLDSRKPRAAFVMLAREVELDSLLKTIWEVQMAFNGEKHARYPYILLSDPGLPFSPWFQSKIKAVASSAGVEAHFAEIPKEHWDIPSWIDQTRMYEGFKKMKAGGMLYGDSLSYRKMCRYQSGFFWRHPMLDNLDYYWRLEPGVKYPCDMRRRDPFRFMRDNGKKYGFVITIKESPGTIRTLWMSVLDWINTHEHLIPADNSLRFVAKPHMNAYNKCHFYFEIADLSLWRSQAYQSFWAHLDAAGGTFYERWGDAPVHSIAASMLLNRDEIHYFEDIGYFHNPIHHCPRSRKDAARCACDPHQSFDYDKFGISCQREWDALQGINSTEVILRINEAEGIRGWGEYAGAPDGWGQDENVKPLDDKESKQAEESSTAPAAAAAAVRPWSGGLKGDVRLDDEGKPMKAKPL
ncbi:glycosyltransferase family 15 protein [Ceraceosorus bombacis]|uniref:Glycosyltransferase family 15 protein n=1 Tax=Ceraceosorus bombacis TaxID=401625 RepID=A0A0P1BLF1_9BASI|nr:glycosyltransferase family 15 protein [Ceraceosorus bombacis]